MDFVKKSQNTIALAIAERIKAFKESVLMKKKMLAESITGPEQIFDIHGNAQHAVNKNNPNVIFIGSFVKQAADGSVGGIMYACRSLVQSKVNEHVNFFLIDSTVACVPVPPPHKRLKKVFGRFFLLLKYLLTQRIDKALIFSSTGFSFIEKGLAAIICRLFGVKVIFAPCSGLIKDKAASSTLFRLYVKLIMRLSHRVICQGESWKQYYSGLYAGKDPNKYEVLLNWIDIDTYVNNKPVYENKKECASTLLYLGWLESYKGIFDLVNAIALIKDKISELQVHIYGSGNAEEEAKAICKAKGIAHICIFKGRADAPTKFKALANADMYVLPSHAEGFPNALVEAMASGLPSIACNVGGVSEVVITGQTGMLVQSHDVQGLADAIYSVYSDQALRNRLSSNGRKIVMEKNSLPIAEERMTDILLNETYTLHPGRHIRPAYSTAA